MTDVKLARVFDTSDETGPGFAPDHPTMADGPERERVLAYLRAGTDLLMTLGTMPDVVDPARGAVVPMSFRTDGVWIWTDTVTYYLERHGLAPDPDLLHHIQSTDGLPAVLDDATFDRAMAVIMPSQ